MRRIIVGLASALVVLLLLTSVLTWNGLALTVRPLSDLEAPPSPLQLVSSRQASVALPLAHETPESPLRLWAFYRESPDAESPVLHRLNASAIARVFPCFVLLIVNHPKHAPPALAPTRPRCISVHRVAYPKA